MAMDERQDDAFGFGHVSNSAKERIKQIRPSIRPESLNDLARIDAVADNAGFVSREASPAAEYAYPARVQSEQRIALNMRVPVGLGRIFQKFCDDNRYSYPEAMAEIMKRAGLTPK